MSDLLTMYEPENTALRECSFFLISEIVQEGHEPIRLTSICPDFTYLTTCTGAILFPPGTWGELERTILSGIAKAVVADEAWAHNTLTGVPIDAHVGYEHDGYSITVHFYALYDSYVGPVGPIFTPPEETK